MTGCSDGTVGTPLPPLTDLLRTPISPDRLRDIASPATDPDLLNTVTSRLSQGADIGYMGPLTSSQRPNNSSALANPDALSAALNLEVARGHTAGPFPSPPLTPFRCNPLGARTKPDGSVRIILDLSQPDGRSVNDNIDRASFSIQYITMDQAVAALFAAGPRGALMAKADLKHAFRLLPVRPDQWWLLGFSWRGQYYFDVRVPFGLRSACAIFSDLAQVLRDAVSYHSSNPLVFNYLDDFFFFSPAGSPRCAASYETFLSLCHTCSFPVAQDKCEPPSTCMELLGCVLNTADLTISLPSRKVQGIVTALRSVRSARKVRQRDLLSLVGKLVHATKCIPAGRSFFRRLLDTAHTVKRPHHWVTLTGDTKRDLDWWLHLLPSWNGTAPLLHPTWTPPSHLHLHTDASRVGYGGMCGTQWFAEQWPAATLAWTRDMSWMEMIPILAACALWGPNWAGLRVTFHCDNSGVVGACAKGWSHDPCLMSLLRQTTYLAATHSFLFRVQHVAGHDNATADALSRLQLYRFRTLQPAAHRTPTPVPPSLRRYLAQPSEQCEVATGFAI